VTRKHNRFSANEIQSCVGSSHEALRGRFLVSGGAVDLAGEIEPPYPLGFQRVPELGWIEIVVFNGISRRQEFRPLEAMDGMDHVQLHLERKTVRGSVGIHFQDSPASGSMKTWWSVWAVNFTTLSSMDGQ
jgi:hypothetical protein